MARIAALVILLMTLSALTAGGVVVGATLLASTTPASACPTGPGTFEPAPEMGVPRFLAPSVQLSDGRVLIVGGYDAQEEFVAAAELYDPATESWTSAGTLANSRVSGTVLLDGDRVLTIPSQVDAPAEIWDPKTGTFSTTGSLGPPRPYYNATALHDGRVLMTGHADASDPTADTLLWDPGSGEFVPAGPLGDFLPYISTLLDDGRVLLVGTNAAGEPIAMTWDPDDRALSRTRDPIASRSSKALLLPDGRVLLAGGLDPSSDGYPPAIAEAELYDPATGEFSPAGSLAHPRASEYTLTLLPDGNALVVGGWLRGWAGTAVGEAEIWDHATGAFIPAGTLAQPRAEHGAALLPDCSVLIISGTIQQPSVLGNERWVPGQ